MVGSSPEWEVWPLCLIFFFPVIAILLMDVTEINGSYNP